MKMKLLYPALLLSAISTSAMAGGVSSFEAPSYKEANDSSKWMQIATDSSSKFELTATNATDGAQAVLAQFKETFKPVMVWNWGSAWDWSDKQLMTLDVVNDEDKDVVIAVKLLDAGIVNNWSDNTQTSIDYFTIPAKKTMTIEYKLDGGNEYQTHGENFDKKEVVGVQVMLAEGANQSIYFDNLQVK